MIGDNSKKANESGPTIVWFRDDLRVSDNPALDHASTAGHGVIPLFVHDTYSPGIRKPGAAQSWMLHHALGALDKKLTSLGAPLIVRQGEAGEIIGDLVEKTGATAIAWNRRIGQPANETDRLIAEDLRERGLEVKAFNGNLMHDPASLLTGEGGPYRVYSPFWRAFEKSVHPRDPIAAPKELKPFKSRIDGETLESLDLLPKPDWAGGLRESWEVGEDGAHRQLQHFIENGLPGYSGGRDCPAAENVSRLSPYLRWGMISPFQVWHAADNSSAPRKDVIKFLKELGWREFSYHLLHHYPDLDSENYDSRFDDFPWHDDRKSVRAWQKGQTGYPLVDAGMRELWHTGYMHNRVRMVAASFLIKHLMTDWRAGEAWFWDTLVDGDPANNPASWQWVAGSGADAAPYFRIFNPILQSRKFDPKGEYVRRWVPEIAELEDRDLHAPWEAPESRLKEAGIRLGETYPAPITSHDKARKRALAAFESIKKEE